jgi:hypothetical protein
MVMTDSLLATSVAVFPRMLEDTAFLFAEEVEGPLEFQDQPVGVGIAYEGPEFGTLHLWAQASFTKVLAANMLGIEENDAAADARRVDALGELLNIVLGHCLTERFGDDESMRMGLPHVLPAARLEIDQDLGHWLSVEGEPVLIAWKENE